MDNGVCKCIDGYYKNSGICTACGLNKYDDNGTCRCLDGFI